MTEIKKTSQRGQRIIEEYEGWGRGDIYSAYDRPSSTKVYEYNKIQERAWATPGYNHDLKVVGANSFNFSTIYSYTDEAGTHIVKDTVSNTFIVNI